MFITIKRGIFSSSLICWKLFSRSAVQVYGDMGDKLTSVRPPGIVRNWDLRTYDVQNLESQCSKAIIEIKNAADFVASAHPFSYDTVLKPLLECDRLYGRDGNIYSLFTVGSMVAESAEIRTTCSRLKGILNEAFLDLHMRTDIYHNLKKYKEEKSKQDNLSKELSKVLDRLILKGQRNGLELSKEVQEEVKRVKKEMSLFSLQFCRNLGEDNTLLYFSKDDLEGMDIGFLSGLEKDEATGKYILTLKYPDYIPVMKKCVVPETRRSYETAFNSRCVPQNVEILENLVRLREEQAGLLGYSNHAAYTQEILMAKSPEIVEKFFRELYEKVKTRWEQERAKMLELKKQDCDRFGYEYDGLIHMWDFSRLYHMMIDKEFSLDQDLLKQYFPLEVVLEGMLKIYQGLLGLRFTKFANPEVWSDEVTAYEVTDTDSGSLMGYFYLDLFPREGKYGHARCGILQQACLDVTEERQKVGALLICNFPRPTPTNPSLLSHDEVVTLFHEFGHAMHIICAKAETSLLLSMSVEWDFVEAPSQMLENWCYVKDSLRLMSKHYKTGEALPDDMLENLVKSKKANGGAMKLRQITLATVDQRMHREGRYELGQMYKDALNEFMGLEPTVGTNMLASFSHLAEDYDARYYSYMWSLVYGEDMFETVFGNEGVLNPLAGRKYRQWILEPGATLDGMEMLKGFLGREPSLDPFLRAMGLLPTENL